MKIIKILTLTVICFMLFSCREDEMGKITKWRINHYTEDCVGAFPQKCLLVQEGASIGTGDWQYFYSFIKGFEYEEGYVYDLLVKQTDIIDPPMDASSIDYELVELLSKEKH
ncbi:DUF4377 domain-containing protein [Aureispira anguillae]|uniref:DUF4377 domain-containing protein n=1 Tax=Aureispira anguillae TaxID=2864201 RepID=A0A916DS75_9BACT|nr:DUF4377 domain-containing protein [Aureispira anguillae]BDS10631.1 DUF4377 domain-containing protein [Aureispira anguillae]